MVATDDLQQEAHFLAPNPFVCLHNPDVFIMPILLDGGMPEVGGDSDEQIAFEVAEDGEADVERQMFPWSTREKKNPGTTASGI